MAVSSNSAPAHSIGLPSFSYESLPDPMRYIRLLTVHSISPSLSCTISQHALSSLQTTSFSALSYAWGKQDRTCTLIINQSTFRVTSHLYEALCRIYEVKHTGTGREQEMGEEVVVWNDAICINQINEAETGPQMQLMDKIYGSAESVIGWLGPADEVNNSDTAMDAIENLVKGLAKMENEVVNNDDLPEGLPLLESNIWRDVGHLYERDWFKRLWVFQEVVLAKDLVCLCGKKAISWDQLSVLADLLTVKGLQERVMGRPVATSADAVIVGGLLAVRHLQLQRESMNKHGQLPSISVLLAVQNKEVTEPKDRIRGVLGLLKPELTHRLGLLCEDYTNDQYLELYAEVGKVLIELDQLLILSLASVTERPIGFPSWCPNFNKPRRINPFGTIVSKVPFVSPDIMDYSNGSVLESNTIRATGLQVDKVLNMARSTFEWPDNHFDEEMRIASAIRAKAWDKECKELFQKALLAQKDRSAYWRTITANLRPDHNDTDNYTNMVRCFEVLSRRPSITLRGYAGGRDVVAFAKAVESANMGGRHFYSTENGRIGLGPPNMKIGDLVCILYTALTPVILRKQDDHRYRLIGETYLHGVMQAKSLESRDRDGVNVPDEVFIIM